MLEYANHLNRHFTIASESVIVGDTDDIIDLSKLKLFVHSCKPSDTIFTVTDHLNGAYEINFQTMLPLA